MNLDLVTSWGNAQVRKEGLRAPHTLLSESIPALTEAQRQTIIDYDFPLKRGRVKRALVPSDYAYLWKAENLLEEGVWKTPPVLMFLQEAVEKLSYFPSIQRIVLHCLEPGGWIRPHSDLPIHHQIVIPLVQDEGFHFVWEHWGRVQMDTYKAYRVDVSRMHTVWNLGRKRVIMNLFTSDSDLGNSLLHLQ